MSEFHWQKSTYSVGEGGNCLYLAAAPDGTIRLRESDTPDEIIATTPARLAALIGGIKTGELSHVTLT